MKYRYTKLRRALATNNNTFRPTSPTSSSGNRDIIVHLTSGKFAKLVVPADITEDDVKIIQDYLAQVSLTISFGNKRERVISSTSPAT